MRGSGLRCPGTPSALTRFPSHAIPVAFALSPSNHSRAGYRVGVTSRTFLKEIKAAIKAYDLHVVALGKSNEEFKASLSSLVTKAIQAYDNRGEGMRHGIALDREVTVILSQADGKRPMCGIYFNLHSPYQRKKLPKTVKPIEGGTT